MTTDEMLKIIINEIKEIRSDIKEIRSDIKRLEDKVDANDQELLDKILALKLITIHTDTAVDKLTLEFKGYRHFTQGAVHDMQIRQQHLEDELEKIKGQLELSRRAS